MIEVDPSLKRELYAELTRDGRTLKNWFTEEAERYVRQAWQPPLFVAEPVSPYPDSSPDEDES